jgi:hypothetical protein
MYSFMLTNWITMRGATTVTSITQSQSGWLDLTGFQDVVAWLDVREANANGGTNVTMTYQTCPTADEVMFAAVTAAFNITSGTVTVTPMLKETTSVPLGRWLRWQLGVTGTPTGPWDASFRIWIAANAGARSRGGAGAMQRAGGQPRGRAMSGAPSQGGGCGGCSKGAGCGGCSKGPQHMDGRTGAPSMPMPGPTLAPVGQGTAVFGNGARAVGR